MPRRLGRQRLSDISLRRLHQLKGVEIPNSPFLKFFLVRFRRNELDHVDSPANVVESRDHEELAARDLHQ